MTPGLIKDKSNQELLDKGVFDKKESGVEKLSQKNERAINEKVETSFQNFLKEYYAEISDIDNRLEKEIYDDKFNERLDEEVTRVLEQSKIDEIESENKNIETDLKSLTFEIELSALQNEIVDDKDETKKTEILKIGEDEIKVNTFSGIEKEDIADIIGGSNFKKKSEIIEFLKNGETEDVRQIQCILSGESYESGKAKGKGRDTLKKYGTDGKFGRETLNALRNYVDHNKIEVSDNSDDGSGAGANESSDGTSSETGSSETNDGTPSANSSVLDTYENTTGIEPNVDAEGNGVEVFDTGDVHVTMKKGENQVLMTGLASSDTIFGRPPVIAGELEINAKGELIYTGKESGQETMTVIVKDVDGKEKYNHIVTFDVKGEAVDGGVDVNGRGGEFDKFMKEIENKGVSERLEMINDKVLENEQIILDLNKKLSLTGDEKKQKRNAIRFIEQLHRENELLSIKEQFSNAEKTELIKKMKQNATIYIKGKPVNVGEFIKDMEKKPELVDNVHIVGLDIDLTKDYRNHLNNNSSQLYNVKTKYELTHIVLSDDENFGNTHDLANSEQIQYKADAMIDMEKKIESNQKISERRALKRLLGIKGLFGRGGVDNDVSIATKDYETNNPVFKERKNLRKLKKVLMKFLEDDNISVKDAFEKVHAVSNGEKGVTLDDDKNLEKLLDLYTIYIDNANGVIGGGDYFQKTMGLLDNYFIRGISGFDETDDDGLFNRLYHNENIGRMDGYIDPDKKKKAIKAIFKGKFDGPDDVNLLGVPFEKTDELRDLKKIVKNIDLGDMMQRIDDAGSNAPTDMDRWEQRFHSLYLEYSDDQNVLTGTTKGVKYYNAAFDLLVGIGEGRQSMVEAVNSLKIAKSKEDIALEGNDEKYYSSETEKKFVMMLADFNSDARADHGDRGVRMGLEIKNVYKNVKVDQMNLYPVSSNNPVAWENLVEFTKLQMRKNGEKNLLSDLEANGGTIDDLVTECNKNPGLLNYMQNVVANSPIPVEEIFRYGDEAAENYLDSGDGELLSRVLDGTIEIKGADELLDQQIQNLVAQGLKVENIPELRTVLKPSFYGGLLQNGSDMVKSVGIGLALNTEKAGTFSLNLGYTDVPGGNGGQAVGIVMAWGNNTELSDKTDLSYGVAAGSTVGSLFIPMVSVNTGIKTLVNEDNLDENLRPKSAKYFHIGVNATMIGALPTWGLYAGLSQDKIGGINKQYKNIENTLAGTDGILYKILTDPRFGTQNEVSLIKNLLLDNFPKSDEKDRDAAANNISRGLSYYNLMDNLDGDDPKVTAIIHDMAENYALQWKNKAMNDAEGDVYLESVGVGVQFLAGYYPIPMVYASVAVSSNTYSMETQQSYADYLSHLTTGNSMERIDDVDRFYDENGITKDAVNYLNDKMSIAYPDISTSKLDMGISVANASNGGGQAKSLYIPQSLYRYVNINIDADVAPYTSLTTFNTNALPPANSGLKENIKYIEVPLNAQIALLSSSKTNAGRFNLIIGDTKAELDDVIVDGNMEDYDGNPADFEGMNNLYMDKYDINTELATLEDITLSTSATTTELIKNPLVTCESVVGGSAIFELMAGGNYIDMGGVTSVLNIVNNKLTMPQFGTLTMYYNANGEYEMYYSSSPSEELNIAFDVEGNSWTSREVVDFNTGGVDMFGTISTPVDSLFTDDIVNKLHNLDNGKKLELDNFLDTASLDLDDGDMETDIGAEEYNEAAKILQDMFGADYGDIAGMLTNGTLEQKSLIVNRMKGIMAYNPKISTGKTLYDEAYKKRNSAYKKLFGPSRVPVGTRLESYRDTLFEDLKDDGGLERDRVEKNLFGYTAFYRAGANEGRNFSMTAPGDTKVLGDKMIKVTDNPSKDWFMENFKLNKVTQKVVLDAMKEQMKKSNPSLNTPFVDKLTVDNLISLMESEGESVDIGGKNVKLDLNHYFYLLGECGNESIGVKIDKIEVTEGGSDNGGQKIDIDPKSAGYLYVDGVEVTNENRHARKKSVGHKIAGGEAIPGALPPNPNPTKPDPVVPNPTNPDPSGG